MNAAHASRSSSAEMPIADDEGGAAAVTTAGGWATPAGKEGWIEGGCTTVAGGGWATAGAVAAAGAGSAWNTSQTLTSTTEVEEGGSTYFGVSSVALFSGDSEMPWGDRLGFTALVFGEGECSTAVVASSAAAVTCHDPGWGGLSDSPAATVPPPIAVDVDSVTPGLPAAFAACFLDLLLKWRLAGITV